jgi:oligoendopeptidase F
MVETLKVWDLSDFYDSIYDPKIEQDIQSLIKSSIAFNEKVKGKLTQSSLTADKLKMWFEQYESIAEKTFCLDTFSQLIYRINSLDDDVKSFRSKVEELIVEIQENLLFFFLELNEINEQKYKDLLKSKELTPYSHAIKFNRFLRPHQLTEKEEQIILMKNITGVNGFIKLYQEIKSNFTYEFLVDGELKTLTAAEIYSFIYSEDKELRNKALKKFLEKYRENDMVFTHIFNNVLKDWNLETKRKNFKSPISQRNLQNEVSDVAVEILGKVTTNSYHIVEKYYNLKKKILHLPELHISDLYAPIGTISKKYAYNEAIDLIRTIDNKFCPGFREIVDFMDKLNHIDAQPRKGKDRGAFCSHGKQRQYPFVFVNYTGYIDSVLALAHELGHAFHAYYIQQTQNFINIDISLVIAEIASVFNEILTFDYLMNSDMSNEEKISLLCIFIENNFGKSHRQNAFYNFEIIIHELLERKLPTTKEIKKQFAEEMSLMFGNSIVNVEEDYADFCFVVSHFLEAPFYVYAYNMSNLLVISIYQLYLEQGEGFVSKYLKILSVGSSLSPEEMLKDIGIDLNDKSFWKKGIKYLQQKVDELQTLIETS